MAVNYLFWRRTLNVWRLANEFECKHCLANRSAMIASKWMFTPRVHDNKWQRCRPIVVYYFVLNQRAATVNNNIYSGQQCSTTNNAQRRSTTIGDDEQYTSMKSDKQQRTDELVEIYISLFSERCIMLGIVSVCSLAQPIFNLISLFSFIYVQINYLERYHNTWDQLGMNLHTADWCR